MEEFIENADVVNAVSCKTIVNPQKTIGIIDTSRDFSLTGKKFGKRNGVGC